MTRLKNRASRRMRMTRPRRSAAGLAALVVLIGAGLSLTIAAEAKPKGVEKTLQQAMAEPHGLANGDPVHASLSESHQGQNQDAKGVDKGFKKQAAGTKTDKKAKPVKAEDLYKKGDFSAGCTVGYGHGKACLPVTPPSAGAMGMAVDQMPWTCAETRTLLPTGIELDHKGVDPANLDHNGDGTACGTGD